LNCDWCGQALDAALKQVKTLSPATSALFFTVDEQAGKVFCLSTVSPDGLLKGLKANEWVGAVAKVTNQYLLLLLWQPTNTSCCYGNLYAKLMN
jgi:hypothetical protein